MKNLCKLSKLVLFLTVLLLILQVVVASRLTTSGFKLLDLQNKEEKIKLDNEILETKIASSSSLMQITQEAQTLGFTKANIFYLDPEDVRVAYVAR